MLQSSENKPTTTLVTAVISRDATPTASATSVPSSPVDRASVACGRTLPPPIRSDRVTSSNWLCGSMMSFQGSNGPHATNLGATDAVPRPPHAVSQTAHPASSSPSSSERFPTPSHHKVASHAAVSSLTTETGCQSQLDGVEEFSYSALTRALTDCDTVSSDLLREGEVDIFDPESKSSCSLAKQVVHKVVERERRRRYNEIVMAMKAHFLPELIPEVSSNSHKSIVPRNILLEYSLAHIVCLRQQCELLARDHDRLREEQRTARYLHDKQKARHPLRTASDSQLDAQLACSSEHDSRDTPPASGPSSPDTQEREDAETHAGGGADCGPNTVPNGSPPTGSRLRTWQSDVAHDIRKYVRKRKEAYCDIKDILNRKRKRRCSDVTVASSRESPQLLSGC